MTLVTTTIPTPPGPFTVIAREQADGSVTVIASGWASDAAALLQTIGPVRLAGAGVTPIDPQQIERRDDLGPISQALRGYLAGDLGAIDTVAVEQAGAPFTTRAWQQLRAIPAGTPATYAQLAASSGNPSAVRAAGSACGRNTAALFVPCHRVLRTGGDLGGFLYGLEVKRWLLQHEAAPVAVA